VSAATSEKSDRLEIISQNPSSYEANKENIFDKFFDQNRETENVSPIPFTPDPIFE